MKYSGVKSIGNVPDSWEIRKVKQCFYISKEAANQVNPVVLSLARSGVKVRDISNNEGQLAASYDNYNVVKPGDLLLNPMDLYSGANCNMSEVEGVISPAYVNLRAKEKLNPKFFDYFFKTQYWTMAMFAHGKGVSFDNRWTMNADAVLNYKLPHPNLNIQNSVVNYLNEKLEELSTLIDNENKQIGSLVSFKRALINKCVTKGINKNVNLVDSGCKWIGMIPDHWEVKKAKFVSTSLEKGSGITKEDVMADGDTACVRYGEIYSKYDNFFEVCLIRTNLDRVSSPSYFESGDILFAGTGELVEEIGKNVLYKGSERCLAGGDIVIMKHNQCPGYLNYAMNSISSQLQKSYGKAKLKVVHISATDIGNIYICLPSLEEQKQISDYLDKKCVAINKLIEIKKDKIEKLEEYKKSLIYEYVTGKKEVF